MRSCKRLWLSLAVAPMLFLVVACTATQVSSALQAAASDANIIATGLKADLPAIATIQGVSPATVASIGALVADIQTISSTITAASSATTALPSVQQLEADFNGIASALSALPLPPQVASVLQAASVLLPLIEMSVGLVVSPRAESMTPDAARAILLGRQ